METTRLQVSDLLRATEGLRNVRALGLLIAGAVLGVLVATLGAATHSTGVTVVALLLAALCVGIGYSAAGVVLMAAAQGQEPPPWSDALALGALAFGKLIAVGIIALIGLLVYWLVLAGVFYACKVPGLGPLLYAIALPIAIVATALLGVFLYVTFSLLFPAFWHGESIRGAIAHLVAVVMRRGGEVVLKLLLLSLVLMLVFGVLLAFLGGATLNVTALSAGILGGGANLLGGMGAMGGGMGPFGGLAGMNGGGHMYAGVFGIGVVWSIAGAAWMSMFILGINLIYLSAIEGIDTAQTEAMLAARMEQARHKAAEFGQQAAQAAHDLQARARQAQEQARQAAVEREAQAWAVREQQAAERARQEATRVPPPAPQAETSCPRCRAGVMPGDAFCGECGFKLR